MMILHIRLYERKSADWERRQILAENENFGIAYRWKALVELDPAMPRGWWLVMFLRSHCPWKKILTVENDHWQCNYRFAVSFSIPFVTKRFRIQIFDKGRNKYFVTNLYICDRRCRLLFPKERFFAKVLNYAHPQTTSTLCPSISKRKSRIGKSLIALFPVSGFSVIQSYLCQKTLRSFVPINFCNGTTSCVLILGRMESMIEW